MRLHTIQANVPADLVGGHEGPVEESPAGLVWQTQQPVLVPDLAEERRWPKVTQHMKEDGANSFCFVPLTTAVRRLGAMGFLSLQKEAYGETDLEFLQQVGKQVAVAVDNVLHHQDLTHDHDRLRLLLEVSEAIVSHRDLSALFRDLAQRLPTVAPFDFIGLILHDPTKNLMKVHVLETAATHHLTYQTGWTGASDRGVLQRLGLDPPATAKSFRLSPRNLDLRWGWRHSRTSASSPSVCFP